MNLENLTQFEKTGKIEKTNFTVEGIVRRYNIASSRIKNVKKYLMSNDDDESVYISAYAELYNSFRILCEVMLALGGYRTSGTTKGHHEAAINTIWLTMDDEKMFKIYTRLKKIGKKRTGMEYGGTFDISPPEIKTMIEDVELVLKKVGQKLEEAKPGQKLNL
ncbi:MAG: hypothetical protein HYV53_02375 [Parcubacteria group bacterium]|nr:hypothetical protein [Parcubacteria group bacterium]